MTTAAGSRHVRSSSSSSSSSVAVAVAVASALPVVLLTATAGRDLWLDEAASATLAELPGGSFRRVLLDREGNGLLHTVLLRGWQALGLGDAASRVPSVLAGIAAVAFLTALTVRVADRRTALFVPPLLVTNPLFVRYVVEARSYALVLALVCGGGLLLLRALERPTVLRWCAYAAVMGIAVYAHYFALFVVAAHALAVALRRPFPRVAPVLPAAVLYLVLVSGVRRLMTDDAASGVGYLSGSPFAKALVVGLAVVAPLALAAAALVLVRRARQGRPVPLRAAPEHWPAVLVLSWLLVPLGLAVVLSVVSAPVLAPRYLLVCLPPAVLVAAAVAARLPRRLGPPLTALACVLGLLLGLLYLRDQTEQWQDAAALVQDAAQPGDEVLFVAPYVRIPFERHWDAPQAREGGVTPAYPPLPWGADSSLLFFDVPLPASTVAAATADAKRVLLVVSHVDLYGTGDPEYDEVVAGLRSVFDKSTTENLRGVRVETWVHR